MDGERNSQNSIDLDKSENSILIEKSQNIEQLKFDAFNLRIRCYNLEEELSNCSCSRNNQAGDTKGFFDQKREINKVIQSQQELHLKNEQLLEENKHLKEMCCDLKENEKKLIDYDSMKMKFNHLTDLIKKDGSNSSVIEKLLSDYDILMKINIDQKFLIRNLEKKLADKNKSIIDDQFSVKESLSNSLAKIFKNTSESSSFYHNNFQSSFQLNSTCVKCDELKVYSDQLSETIIKMSVDFETVYKSVEQKNSTIKELEEQIMSLSNVPTVDEEKLKKYKMILKQALRGYEQEKESKETMKRDFEELIEYYIKEQGKLQAELSMVNKQIDNNVRIINEGENLGKLMMSKLDEVSQVNKELSSTFKSVANRSVIDDEVGQYSPQHKICRQMDSTITSNSSSSYYYRGEISLNETAFRPMTDEGEVLIEEMIGNMDRKVRELGEVVESYRGIMKCSEKSNVKSDNRLCAEKIDLETSSREDNLLKKIYEEEKLQFENLLKDRKLKIEELKSIIQSLKEENANLDKIHKLNFKNLSCKYEEETTKNIKEINDLKENIDEISKEKYQIICELERKNNEKEKKINKFTNKIVTLESTIKDLQDDKKNIEEDLIYSNENFRIISEEKEKLTVEREKQIEEYKNEIVTLTSQIKNLQVDMTNVEEALIFSTDNFRMKSEEMENVFFKLKNMIFEKPHLFKTNVIDDINEFDLISLWKMLELLKNYLGEKNDSISEKNRSGSKAQSISSSSSSSSWKVTSDKENKADFSNYGKDLYTSSLRIQDHLRFQCKGNTMNMSDESPLIDLTNVTDLEDNNKDFQEEGAEKSSGDKYRFIRENPEKIHLKMKYYYETCQKLKSLVIQRHEENKQLKRNFGPSLCETIAEMTKKLDEYKKQLSLYRQCLERSRGSLPDSVTKELQGLGLL